MASEPLRAHDVAVPFAAMGLVGGVLAADLFPSPEETLTLVLALATSFSCATFGWILAPHVRRSLPHLALWLLFGTAAAGVVNGMLVMLALGGLVDILLSGDLFRWVLGPIVGLFASMFFAPPLALVALAARYAPAVRRRSLAAGADPRGVVGVTLCIFAVAALLTQQAQERAREHVALLLDSVVGAFVLLAAFDAVALARLGRARRELPSAELRAHDGSLPVGATRVDFGVGDDVREIGRAPGYRTSNRSETLYLGSPDAAFEALSRALARDVALLLLALATSVLAWRLAPT